jgi:molecular chaperone GrpE
MNPFKRNNPEPNDEPGEPTGESQHAAEGLSNAELHEELRASSALLEQLQRERDEAQAAHKHALADFANYQRRAVSNEQVARQQGAGAVVMSVVGVIDHFDLALNQDLSKATPQQIVDGVKVIREELIKALQHQGVSLIVPKVNDEFVPGKHEAIMHQAAPDVAPGHVSMVLQSGYALGERVLRPAKVAVAPSA